VPSTLRLHPFCAAVYPVLGLAAANAWQLPSVTAVLPPAAVALAFAALVYLVLGALIRDPGRRALAALLIVALFGGYGRIAEAVRPYAGAASESGDEIAVPLVAAVGALGTLALARLRFDAAAANRFLDRAGCIVLLFPMLSLGYARLGPSGAEPAPLPLGVTARLDTARVGPVAPDIYLIVLDKYTGSSSLRRNYGFDNSGFEEALRSRGFVVPRRSRSNYIWTMMALASILNWDYVQHFPGYEGSRLSIRALYGLTEHNRTARLLKSLGYQFVFFPTVFPTTFQNRAADLQLPPPSAARTEFAVMWLRATPIVPALKLRCLVTDCRRTRQAYVPESAERIDWKFDQLGRLPSGPGPRFVFAHMLLPHEPYIYGPACEHREPYWPARDDGPEEATVKAAYVAQIQCVNRKVLRLVDSLRGRSRVPPIILLQADHGHGRLGRVQVPLEATPADRLAEATDIFAAYHLPAGGSDAVYDGISPVNLMRVVLDHYFDTGLGPLPDETWWSHQHPPFRFTRLDPGPEPGATP
jgi:hypothetical protein